MEKGTERALSSLTVDPKRGRWRGEMKFQWGELVLPTLGYDLQMHEWHELPTLRGYE